MILAWRGSLYVLGPLMRLKVHRGSPEGTGVIEGALQEAQGSVIGIGGTCWSPRRLVFGGNGEHESSLKLSVLASSVQHRN